MMAADALHVAVYLIVPSGVPIRWPSAFRRVCSAGASALHFALPSHVQASCLERARSAALITSVRAFADALAAYAAEPPCHPLPGRPARGKGGRRDKRSRHPGARKAGLHMGLAQHAPVHGTVLSNDARPHECWHDRVPATRQHATQRQDCMASNGGKRRQERGEDGAATARPMNRASGSEAALSGRRR